MNDPNRLLDDDTTELERLLLSAVTRERPSRGLTRRMRSALGLAGSLFTLKAAAAALSVATIVAGAAVIVDRREAERPVVPVATSVPRRIVVERPENFPAASPAQVGAAAPPTDEAPAPGLLRQKMKAAAAAAPDLRAQMQLLDRARSSLKNGAPAVALSALDRYRKLYPNGAFAQEASVLRIEALNRAGDRVLASALARDFIRKHADSPHVERLSQSLEPTNPKR